MKFRGIKFENTLSQKSHIDMILPEMSAACLATEWLNHLCLWKLKMIYYA